MANRHLNRHQELHEKALGILQQIRNVQTQREINAAMAANKPTQIFWDNSPERYEQEDKRLAAVLDSLYGQYTSVMIMITAECKLPANPGPPLSAPGNRLKTAAA